MSIAVNLKTRTEVPRRILGAWGLDLRRLAGAVQTSAQVRRERQQFKRQSIASGRQEDFPMGRAYPVYADRFDSAGQAKGHYFHQDLFVAREIFARKPRRHIDVGSSVYGFVSHVASFREIEVVDIRPLTIATPGISFVQLDLMNLRPEFEGIADSVSCLHALEHFGLGRYGDPVDYDGWRKGLYGLRKLLEPNGVLYLSVPTGKNQRVEFNAHRVFSLPFLRDTLEDLFSIEVCSFVDDEGDFHPNVDPWSNEANLSFESKYGLSIWILRNNMK